MESNSINGIKGGRKSFRRWLVAQAHAARESAARLRIHRLKTRAQGGILVIKDGNGGDAHNGGVDGSSLLLSKSVCCRERRSGVAKA